MVRLQGSISQSTKIHLQIMMPLYCDITLCLAIKSDLQLKSILTLCEIRPRTCNHKVVGLNPTKLTADFTMTRISIAA